MYIYFTKTLAFYGVAKLCYSSIILGCFNILLFPKLCQHIGLTLTQASEQTEKPSNKVPVTDTNQS